MSQIDLFGRVQLRVAAAGHEWIDTPDGAFLTERELSTPIVYRHFKPFSPEYASLFMRFSQLATSREGVLAFANQYGLLGSLVTLGFDQTEGLFELGKRGELLDERTLSPASVNEMRRVGRTPQSWASHIRLMRGMTRWAIEKKAGRTLWTPKDVRPRELPRMIQHEGALIARRVSSVLQAVVQPTVLWVPRDSGGRHGRFRLVLQPDSLIGVLWLQASLAIAEQKGFRRCAAYECENFIELSRDRGGKRTDAKFCSDACKSRNYRRRRGKRRLGRR